MGVDDVRRRFGDKYDEGIQEMYEALPADEAERLRYYYPDGVPNEP